MQRFVFSALQICLTNSVLYASKLSKTSKAFFLFLPVLFGHFHHTFSNHTFIPTSSIHSFGCIKTIIPLGRFLGIHFSLKITRERSFEPSARIVSTHIN